MLQDRVSYLFRPKAIKVAQGSQRLIAFIFPPDRHFGVVTLISPLETMSKQDETYSKQVEITANFGGLYQTIRNLKSLVLTHPGAFGLF